MTATPKPRTPKPTAAKPPAKAKPASAEDAFNEVCSIRIELRDTDPLIWREVEVPTSISLEVLHGVVQIAMGWFNCHMWEFTIDRQAYGLPMEDDWGAAPLTHARKTRLRDVLKPRRTRIDYLYDMGDSWEHKLIVSNVRQGDPALSYPRYVAGEWAAPPEDCGGITGFYTMLAAMADPTHPEHADITEWLGDYNPKEIDPLPRKIGLDRIATRRDAARKRPMKAGN